METEGKAGIVKKTGRAIAREAGYIAGTTAIKGWAGVMRGCAASVQRYARDQLSGVSPEELGERKADFQAELKDMSQADYQEQMRHWRVSSRWFYFLSLLLLALTVLATATDWGGPWTLLDGSALALYLFVRGLAAAYRCYQMQAKVFFQPGSFSDWIRQGVWIV